MANAVGVDQLVACHKNTARHVLDEKNIRVAVPQLNWRTVVHAETNDRRQTNVQKSPDKVNVEVASIAHAIMAMPIAFYCKF